MNREESNDLVLEHAPNPDIVGGYWEYPVDPRKIVLQAADEEDARRQFIAWRDRNGLGGGNLRKAQWRNIRFSYNGRSWPLVEQSP